MTIQVKATEQYFSACNAVYYAVQNGSREPYQTVSTVYFILGILRTDLWSQRTIERSAASACQLILSFWLYFKNMMKESKIQSDIEVDDKFWTSSILLPSTVCF